jgi:hypothetical protein
MRYLSVLIPDEVHAAIEKEVAISRRRKSDIVRDILIAGTRQTIGGAPKAAEESALEKHLREFHGEKQKSQAEIEATTKKIATERLKSGEPVNKISQEMGISRRTLYSWRAKLLGPSNATR